MNKTSTITIGVPLKLFTEKATPTIPYLLKSNIEDIDKSDSELEEYKGKTVPYSYRVEIDLADKVRTRARDNKMTIIEYTCRVLNWGN